MDQKQYLNTFKKFIKGMIDKDASLLIESMSKDASLYHMTGYKETREEYIRDILNGTLNYYDYKIISFNENEAVIKLLAKVYGGSKSWWTLRMSTVYVNEEGTIKIKESKVRMA